MSPAPVPGTLDRVHGGLVAAVAGDAFGAALETMTRRRVRLAYGRLEEMVLPEHSPFSGGRKLGQFTDDSSLIVALSESIIATRSIELDDVVAVLIAWAADEEMRGRFAGPTTRVALRRLEAGEDPREVGKGDVHTVTGVTNGGAMKVAPAGWINPGELDRAVRDALTLCLPTHNTQIAIAGASAIAAGVAHALEVDATVDSMVSACLEGARAGEALGLEFGREAPGPSVARRIELAVQIARSATDLWDAVDEVSAIIGSGLPTTESVPAAIAMFAAAEGDPRQAIIAAANLGDDADTVACIAGALAGTLSGVESVPADWNRMVTEANAIDLQGLASGLADVGAERRSQAEGSNGAPQAGRPVTPTQRPSDEGTG